MRLAAIALALTLAVPADASALREALTFKNFPTETHDVGTARFWVFHHKKGEEKILMQVGKFTDRPTAKEARKRYSPDLFLDGAQSYLKSKGCAVSGGKALKWNTYVFDYKC